MELSNAPRPSVFGANDDLFAGAWEGGGDGAEDWGGGGTETAFLEAGEGEDGGADVCDDSEIEASFCNFLTVFFLFFFSSSDM